MRATPIAVASSNVFCNRDDIAGLVINSMFFDVFRCIEVAMVRMLGAAIDLRS